MATTKQKWDKWELIAIKYLKQKWYKILQTNYKFSRFWEIDIIWELDWKTVFFEVKYRENLVFWEWEEAITKQKKQKIKKSIYAYLMQKHMDDENVTYNVGGKETYTYEEMAKMCFRAAGKPVIIKDSPVWMFSILANLPKIKKEGKHDIIMFSKWTLSHDLVGDTHVGEASFAEYIKEYFGGKK